MKYKVGICEWAFPFPGPASFQLMAELGIQGVELEFGRENPPYKLHHRRVQDAYLEFGQKYGIEFPSIAVNTLEYHAGLNKPKDSKDGEYNIRTIQKGIDTADYMKIPVVQFNCFGTGEIHNEEEYEISCDYIRFACDYAAQYGISIGHENPMDAAETKKFVKDIDRPNFGIMFDTQNHYLMRGINEAQLLRDVSDHVLQIHIKDCRDGIISSAILGEGDSGFFESAEVINSHYKGEWLILENYYGTRPLCDTNEDFCELVLKDMEVVRKVFG